MDIIELQSRNDSALALVMEALTADTELEYEVSTFAYGNHKSVKLAPDADVGKLNLMTCSSTTIIVRRGRKRVFTVTVSTISGNTKYDILVHDEHGCAFVCENVDDMQMLLSEYDLDCPPPVIRPAAVIYRDHP